MLIAIDFDGTCVEHKFPDVGPDMPHAVEVLSRFSDAGFKLILWTCREDHPSHIEKKYLQDAVDWFKQHNIPLYGVNATPVEAEFRDFVKGEKTTIRKAYANIYIDDRNLGGLPQTSDDKPDWLEIGRIVFAQAIDD